MAKKLNVEIGKYDVRGTGLSEKFMHRVGSYKYIMEYASDAQNGLDIQLRGDCINIYYEGGSLLKLSGQSCIYLDKNYFYQPNKIATRITDIERLCKKDYKELAKKSKHLRTHAENPTVLESMRKDALDITAEIKHKRDEIISRLKKCTTYRDTSNVLEEIKLTMHRWKANLVVNGIRDNVAGERTVQHYISLYNKDTNKNSNFVVLDIEYSISTNAIYAKENEREKQPRIDIIAIEKKTGQLYVMELKYGMHSVDGDAGIRKHYDDYLQSVGHEDKWQHFVKDIKALLKAKKDIKAVDKGIFIKDDKPIFAFIMKCKDESDVANFKQRLKGNNLESVPTIYLPKEEDENYSNPTETGHILKSE